MLVSLKLKQSLFCFYFFLSVTFFKRPGQLFHRIVHILTSLIFPHFYQLCNQQLMLHSSYGIKSGST
jgi:hypothetical protein